MIGNIRNGSGILEAELQAFCMGFGNGVEILKDGGNKCVDRIFAHTVSGDDNCADSDCVGIFHGKSAGSQCQNQGECQKNRKDLFHDDNLTFFVL